MRRCTVCGEDIARHTYASVPLVVAAMIQRQARDLHDARRRMRHAARQCPIEVVREEKGMAVYRAVREGSA